MEKRQLGGAGIRQEECRGLVHHLSGGGLWLEGCKLLFGTKCDKCGLSFSKNDFVMRAKTKIYHIDCFRCTACERQLIPGDEFALRDDGLFCKEDHEVLEKAGGCVAGESNNNNVSSINNNNNSNSRAASTHEGSNSGKFIPSAMNY
ncbi:hypothetical protein B566_EDAN007255 [Ephemera danica]|nr:hypothetical protein B566_EDAN007255 [Ephemera danica]